MQERIRTKWAAPRLAVVTLAASLVCGFGAVSGQAQQVSIWNGSVVPGTINDADANAVEVGVKFQSSVAGSVLGVRFYKGSQNTGSHVGHLWTRSGTLLGTVTFANETASGWQQANFSKPIAIQANTTYIVSYYCPNGHYSSDDNYFNSAVSNSSLTALKNGTDGPNGVYVYNRDGFPNQSWEASNYWVDVAFVTSGSSGSSGSTSLDSIWKSSAVPGTVNTSDANAVELGVKFQSTVAGTVEGVRFYKGSQNTGTHVGHLWSKSGNLLASVTFTNETPSGWQQANFSTPVVIQPNTTYIVSYYAPNGYYSSDNNYFNSAVVNSPLTALKSGTDGPNGVYVYGRDAFPNQSWESSNYWVGVAFLPSDSSGSTGSDPSGSGSPGSSSSSVYTISGTVSGAAATLTLSGAASASTTTDSSGNYSFSGLADGSYVVAPSAPDFTFIPSTASVTINGAPKAGVNFTATVSKAPIQHKVTLTWTASSSPDVIGYCVYRSTVPGGPYTELAGPIDGTQYVDNTVSAGETYYYVATAVNGTDAESNYSNQATAPVPLP